MNGLHPQGDPEDMVLRPSRQQLKQSGHNTICRTGLRALKDHPELATQKIVHGLKRLMQQFDQAPPGKGYFGKAQGWLTEIKSGWMRRRKEPLLFPWIKPFRK